MGVLVRDNEGLEADGCQTTTMYDVGEKVQVRDGRRLTGSWTIERVNSDGTYDLIDASGSRKRGVRERDIG